MNTEPVFAPVYLPLLGASIVLIGKTLPGSGLKRALEWVGAGLGLLLPWAALAVMAPVVLSGGIREGIVGGWHPGIGIAWRFDGITWGVDALGLTIAGAAWIYSRSAGPRGPLFTALFLIQTSSLAATIMTADLFNLFVSLEVMGLASYALVTSGEKKGAALASFSYLMVSATAMIVFLLGLYGLYRLTGSLSYRGIATGLTTLPNGGGITAQVSVSMIAAAIALRVAVMPVYGWLPDAHALAPHAVSAVLSGVLIKTPLFALTRVLDMSPIGTNAANLLGVAGAATAVLAVLLALAQSDAKRLLAYHSVSQIGYVMCGWGAALSLGPDDPRRPFFLAAAFLHAFYHALFKGLLFLSVGTTTDVTGERNVYRLRGAARTLRLSGEIIPVTAITFLVGALAITAIPPLNGFASKAALTYMLKGTWQGTLLTAAGAATMASFIKLGRIYFGSPTAWPPPAGDLGGESARRRMPAIVAQLSLATLCLLTGLMAPGVSSIALRLMGAGGSAGPLPSALYSTDTLLKTGVTILVGILLYLLASTNTARQALKLLRNRRRGFDGLFLSFTLGLGAMILWVVIRG